MSDSKERFRDQLLDLESVTPTLKECYEKEVKAMVEKRLTGWSRAGCFLGLALGLFFVVVFGAAALYTPLDSPWFVRGGFILGAIFGALFIGLELCVLKRGTTNLKTDDMAAAGLGWGFTVILTTIFLVNADRFPDPTRMLVVMMIFLYMAGLQLLKAFIQKSEVRTQEKLLEIEYQIAVLSEKIENQ